MTACFHAPHPSHRLVGFLVRRRKRALSRAIRGPGRSAGGNRQFINGSPTTLNVLSSLGEWLVDIHGPHEHQSLLHPARQLAILDAFGGLDGECDAFGELVLKSNQALPSRIPASSPFSPVATASTSGGPGSEVKTMSLAGLRRPSAVLRALARGSSTRTF